MGEYAMLYALRATTTSLGMKTIHEHLLYSKVPSRQSSKDNLGILG